MGRTLVDNRISAPGPHVMIKYCHDSTVTEKQATGQSYFPYSDRCSGPCSGDDLASLLARNQQLSSRINTKGLRSWRLTQQPYWTLQAQIVQISTVVAGGAAAVLRVRGTRNARRAGGAGVVAKALGRLLRSAMAGEAESPDDVSAMMEELWGPRAEGPIGDVARGPRDRTGAADEPPEQSEADAPDEQVPPGVAGRDRFDPAELRSELEAHVALMLQAQRTEMERSMTEAVGQLAERIEAKQSDLRAALEAQVEQLQMAIDREAARAGAAVDRADRAGTDVARIISANEDLGELQGDMGRRLDQVAERLEQLVATVESERGQVAAALASHRSDLEAAATTVAPAGDDGRLEALEREVSERGEYHAARDAELEALRAEIRELRDAMRQEAPPQSAPFGDADQGRGWRKGRKG